MIRYHNVKTSAEVFQTQIPSRVASTSTGVLLKCVIINQILRARVLCKSCCSNSLKLSAPKSEVSAIRSHSCKASVLGLCGKVVVARGVTGVASVRSCWELPLCPTEPIPASSKMDLLLAGAKPTRDSGSASVITYLRREKFQGNKNDSQRERSEDM